MTGVLSKRLFHACLEIIVAPLRNRKPRWARDADGWWRQVITWLAAYLADLEEQYLVAALMSNRCPGCLAEYHDLDKAEKCPERTAASILDSIERVKRSLGPQYTAYQFARAAKQEGLCGVERPFWKSLIEANVDICRVLSSDILHGCFKFWMDHVVKWNTNVISKTELDNRIKSQPHQPGFRSFPSGISKMTQWTCRQTRDLQKIFIPATIGAPKSSNKMNRANRSALDYIQIAQFPCHSDKTIADLEERITGWETDRVVFIENGGRKGDDSGAVIPHFKIPKIHSAKHLPDNIRRKGALDGQSTETPERYHPLVSKNGYRLTNHKDFQVQMLRWLNRHERINALFHYFDWWMSPVEDEEDEEVVENNRGGEASGVGGGVQERGGSRDNVMTPISDSQRLAKNPHRKSTTLDQLATEHSIPGLNMALATYLRSIDPSLLNWPPEFAEIDVWHDCRVEIPVPNDYYGIEWRRIRASPKQSPDGFSHFDPVLIHETDEAEVIGLDGYSVEIDRRKMDPHTRLHPIHKLYTPSGQRVGRVIELSSIVRPCPLSPVIEGEANILVNPHNAMLHYQQFYINPFLTHSDYRSLR